jgi:hypothetical protein
MKTIATLIAFITLAGTLPADETVSAYKLIESSYKTTKTRDPFADKTQISPSSKQVAGTPLVFRLDGILYETNDPSASINGTLVRLNKPVTLVTDSGTVKVKAIEITREKVVLEVNDQKVELKISASR